MIIFNNKQSVVKYRNQVEPNSALKLTIFPGPLAVLSGLVNDTMVGDTKTAREPSEFNPAVPNSLMVLFMLRA